MIVELLLVEAPGFPEEPFYPVSLGGEAKLLLRDGETDPYGRKLTFLTRDQVVNNADRGNRKRLSCTEKRINMLLALKPLVCLKSITNGA